ncbi:D-alanyl-D-alanine carboxypeptidase/D-alanyl-D-alanine-endopeptidase [bacterium]|nr:D-alanyl-D-alanine carboxypeptidase/D-alanyl-D-alanine-endopeptidase [bacterium]
MRSLLTTSALCLWLAAGVAATPPPKPANANELKQRIYQMIRNSPASQRGQVGVYVQVLKTGRVVYSENAIKPMIPASNLKVVTTATALDLLGPEYRYVTELRGGAPDAKGVLHGDLYLKGSGDPTMCLPYVSPTAPWKFFVKQLKEKGIRSIEGDLVGDDSAFDRQYIGQGWFDRYLLDSYAAPISALSLNSNVVELTITSQGVSLDPSSSGFQLQKQYSDGGYEECWITRERNSEVTVVKGTVPSGSVIKRTVTVPNPGIYTLGSLAGTLKNNGITVRGKSRLISLGGEVGRCRSTPLIAQYKSPRLKDIAAQVNKESDNVFAGHIFKTLGAHSRGQGTAANSEAAVRDFMREHGVSPDGLVMVDGSGLSTDNRISPRQLVGVVEIMWRHGYGQAFVDSLPTGGEGTLTSRLGGMVVRAKTGTLEEHSALTGYLVSAYGQTLGFSILVNNVDQTWLGVELEDKILHTLAAWDQAF